MADADSITLGIVAVLLVIYLFGGFIKGAAAFGQPMLTIPLSSFWLPVPKAIAISVAPVIFANIVQLVQNRRALPAARDYLVFYAALAVSMICGLVVLSNADHGALLVLIGALILVFVALQLSRWQPRVTVPLRWPIQCVSGAMSGFLAGMTSFVSFPSIPVFVACRLQREVFAAVICVMFLLSSAILSTGLSALGVYGVRELLTAVACVLPSALGQMGGQYVRDRLPEHWLRALVLGMLAAMGLSMVLRGVP